MQVKYIRPNFRALAVGLNSVCASINGIHLPIKELLIQAALTNNDIIYIGPQNGTLASGLELEPGLAYQWGVDLDAGPKGGAFPTPYNYMEILRQAQRQAVGQGQPDTEVYYDLSDFWLVSGQAGQSVKIYWTTRPL